MKKEEENKEETQDLDSLPQLEANAQVEPDALEEKEDSNAPKAEKKDRKRGRPKKIPIKKKEEFSIPEYEFKIDETETLMVRNSRIRDNMAKGFDEETSRIMVQEEDLYNAISKDINREDLTDIELKSMILEIAKRTLVRH